MAVYVDDAQTPYGRMKMCHMVADTVDELHAMANRIGVARKWYQGPPKTLTPHYDICKSKRALAVRHGAVEVTLRDLALIAQRIRKEVRYGMSAL